MTGRWPSTDEMHGARTSAAAARVALLRAAELPPHLAVAVGGRRRQIPVQEAIR
jgi:hypothetical protein